MNRGTVAIWTNDALPTASQLLLGDTLDRVVQLALNDFNQTLNFINESGRVPTAARTIETGIGVGGTLTLNDNAVTNEWYGIVMNGTGRLVKNGTGTLILSKNQGYTGGTTIGGGILQLGNGGAGGLLDGNANIVNNGTLIINSTDPFTLLGSLTGTGGLQKLAASTAALSGTVNYSGNTTVAGGTLQIGASGNLSTSPAIALANAATLDVAATTGLTRSAGQSLSGDGSVLGNVTALPGSTVTVGSSPGTLNVSGGLTLNTATLNMELSGDSTTLGGGVNDLLTVGGTLTLNNVSTIYVTPLAALNTATPYRIMQYGTLSGNPANLTATLPYSGRYTFTVQDAPPYIQLAVTATLDGNLLWRGGNPGNPTRWDVATTTNWLNGAAPDKFLAHDPVAFDDSAATNRATLTGSIVAPSLVALNNSLSYTLDGSGNLTLQTLAMEGSGSFTIANSAANSLGNVTVNNGALSVANTAANTFANVTVNNGSLSVANSAPNSFGILAVTNGTATLANNGPNTFSGLVAAGGTLAFNQPTNVSVTTPIVGPGTVAKDGTSMLTMAADNTAFTGNLQINNGVLRASVNNALGDGTVTIASGATLDFNWPTVNGVDTSLADVVVQGPGVGGLGAILGSDAHQAYALKNVTLLGDTTFGGGWENAGGDRTGAFTGNGYKITKVGAGECWIESKTVDPDFGDVEILEGLFGVQSAGTTMGRAANTITVHTNASVGVYACLTAGSKNIVMHDGANIVAGGGTAGPCLFGGSMFLSNGMSHVRFYSGTTSLATYDGTISGPGTLSVDSVGTFVLAGENMNTGGFQVTNGALRVIHPLALSSNLTVVVQTNGLSGVGQVFGVNVPRLELSDGVVIPPGVTVRMNSSGDCRTSFGVGTATGGNEYQGKLIPNGDGYIPLYVGSTAGLTISGPITNLNFGGALGFRSSSAGSGTCTISGPIRFNGELQANSAAPYTITSTGNQWLLTAVYGPGYLVLGVNDALCTTAPMYLEGTSGGLDLAGFNQTVPSINGTGGALSIGNSSTTADSVLTIDGGTISTITNAIVDSIASGTMKVAVTITNTTVQLFGLNTYTGPTLVKNGGTLGGMGSIGSSPTTVESGGRLSPGASIGTLGIGTLTLNAGSTSYFEVTHTPFANDKLIANTLTLGGTLIVTNTGAAPLAAGDSFQLFEATTFHGNFSSIEPASPGPGLVWNTNSLASAGLLSVASTAPPNMDGVSRLPDGNLQLTLSGPVGSGYTLRASTNVALPLSSWLLLNNGTITVSPFTYDDLTATNFAQRFYRMSIP